jgi:integrase
MPLSDLAARKAKATGKPFKLADGGGLHLLVSPNGSKLWRLKYRFAGKEKLLSFGPYPAVSLADARRRRDEAKKLLIEGTDPSTKKKLDKLAASTAAANTFGAVAREVLENKKANDAAEATMDKNRWLLEHLAAPLADRPIAEITAAEILQLLKSVEKTGRRETARRLRGAIGSVFRYAMVTLRASQDPTLAIHGALLPPKVEHRAAIVDETRFGALLRAIDEFDGWPSLRAALKFLALTFVRPGEVRGATRNEFDLKEAVWRIPAERMKVRRPHEIPLSRQALAVLEDIWPLSEYGDLVFPSIRTNRRPLSENSFNAALRRLGFAQDEMTAHGFRASASTILHDRGYDSRVIEAALGHQDENEIRRAYNRAKYWPERVKLMQDWADLLDSFRSTARTEDRPAA